ncbi:hypothetical protein AVEN_118937-2-1, partial [Araneus ventricosus]
DAIEHTVTEWWSCDTEANQLYTDEEITSLVQNKPQDDFDLEETDEPENVLVSHSEAANALEIALRYIVQSEKCDINRHYVYETLVQYCFHLENNITSSDKSDKFLHPKRSLMCDVLMQCVFIKCKCDP